MINWETQGFHEPPFTSDLTDGEICSFKDSPLSLEICSNSVATERMIRDVDKVASMSICQQMTEFEKAWSEEFWQIGRRSHV